MRPGIVAAACILTAGTALAHDLGTSPVHPVLDLPAASLRDVSIEVAETLAPQILITNHGPNVLAILDEAGRPFARIGPAGVQADLNADAWYRSLSTASMPEPAAAHDPHSPARWTQIDGERSFGWFDARLAVGPHTPSAAMRQADVPATTGQWRVPVTIGATVTAITGRFEYRPPADGAYVTRLIPPAGLPAGIQLHVSQGAIPAILLTDMSRRDVTLVGLQGEDEVRIGKQGVAVNTGSPTWRQWGQQVRAAIDASPPRWLPISHGAAYLWLEPRGETSANGSTHPARKWSLPIRVDGTDYTIEGVATWQER